jgi:hypothetical protein
MLPTNVYLKMERKLSTKLSTLGLTPMVTRICDFDKEEFMSLKSLFVKQDNFELLKSWWFDRVMIILN